MNRRELLALPVVAALAGLARGAADDPPPRCGLLLSPEESGAVKLTSPDRDELRAAIRRLGVGMGRQQRRWACFMLSPAEADLAEALGAERLATWAEWRQRTGRLWNLGPIGGTT